MQAVLQFITIAIVFFVFLFVLDSLSSGPPANWRWLSAWLAGKRGRK